MEFLVVWLLFGVATAVAASNKGLSGCAWFLLGVILGPFGLILSLVVPKNQRAVERSAIGAGTMKKCPFCAEMIRAEAVKCRFCGTDLGGPLQPPPIIKDEGLASIPTPAPSPRVQPPALLRPSTTANEQWVSHGARVAQRHADQAQPNIETTFIPTFCPFCSGKIEFPDYGIGERIQCPHCGKEIILACRMSEAPGRRTDSIASAVRAWRRNHPELRTLALLLLAVVFAALTLGCVCLWLYGTSPERSRLRAIGAMDSLPVAPSAEIAQHFQFEYNVWDRADRVTGAEGYPTAPFRAEVELLESGSEVSEIKVMKEGCQDIVGWVPSDWIESNNGPIQRRENPIRKRAREEADKFLRLTEDQLRAKLGAPIKIERVRDADGGIDAFWTYDETPSNETFFTIWDRNGFVDGGMYKGTKLTPLYK